MQADARAQRVERDGVDRDSKTHVLADRDVGADPDEIIVDRIGDVEIVVVDQVFIDSEQAGAVDVDPLIAGAGEVGERGSSRSKPPVSISSSSTLRS